MEGIEIKSLEGKNWLEFWALFSQTVSQDFSFYPPEAIKRFLDEEKIKKNWGQSKEILVAFKNNEIVGFLIAIDSGGGVSFCNWLGVERKSRRQGIGKNLVQVWEKWAKQRKCYKLRAQTSQRENQLFWESLGFQLEGIKKADRYFLDYFIFVKMI